MIGIEEYEAANAFAVTAALFAVLRFSRDTLIWTRRARIPQFIVAFVAIGVLLGLDLRWTAEQKSASEVKKGQLAKLDQIPILQQRITAMNRDAAQAATSQAVEQGKLEQRLGDIGDDNKRLKLSIEEKDATLAEIAEKQYELNFSPQITIAPGDSPLKLLFSNVSKSSVELNNVTCPDIVSLDGWYAGRPAVIPPGSNIELNITDAVGRTILQEVALPSARTVLECSIAITTLDKKHYAIPFSWVFVVKNSALDSSYAVARPATVIESN